MQPVTSRSAHNIKQLFLYTLYAVRSIHVVFLRQPGRDMRVNRGTKQPQQHRVHGMRDDKHQQNSTSLTLLPPRRTDRRGAGKAGSGQMASAVWVQLVAAVIIVCGRSGSWLGSLPGWWERDPAGGEKNPCMLLAPSGNPPSRCCCRRPGRCRSHPSIIAIIIVSPNQVPVKYIHIYSVYIIRKSSERLLSESRSASEKAAGGSRTPRFPSCPFDGWAKQNAIILLFLVGFSCFLLPLPFVRSCSRLKGAHPASTTHHCLRGAACS